jgi:hypothetical protein
MTYKTASVGDFHVVDEACDRRLRGGEQNAEAMV